jgi:Na+-transporting methylmalonyl-CoA/oxaloacetate decarboxylase gamma subunit
MDLLFIVNSGDFKLGIVFLALTILTVIFNQIPKLFKIQLRSKLRKAGKINDQEECCTDISGETNAVIALALHLYMSELHDMESNVMTIEKVSRRYSPWNSKIYGLRNLNYK